MYSEQNWGFPLRISSLNEILLKKILDGKLRFFVQLNKCLPSSHVLGKSRWIIIFRKILKKINFQGNLSHLSQANITLKFFNIYKDHALFIILVNIKNSRVILARDRWDKLPWKLDFSGLKYFKFADRNLNALTSRSPLHTLFYNNKQVWVDARQH